MKRSACLLTLLLSLTLPLTGCIQSFSAAESAVETDGETAYAQVVYGKIKEINGNEILLAIGQYASGGQGMPSQDGQQGPSEGAGAPPSPEEEQDGSQRQPDPPDKDGDFTPGEGGERPADFGGQDRPGGGARNENMSAADLDVVVIQTAAGGDFPMLEGGPPSGDRPGGSEGPQGDRGPDEAPGGEGGGMTGFGGQSAFTLTGEEKTYLIPVTATITTGQSDNAKSVKFTQLAVKNVVKLNLDDNDRILSVEVLQ